MALIECSECGKQVSDKAAACPACGAPIGAGAGAGASAKPEAHVSDGGRGGEPAQNRAAPTAPRWKQPAIVAAIGVAVLGGGYYFLVGGAPSKTEDECKKSSECEYSGNCTPVGSKCLPQSDKECEQSKMCSNSGRCTFDKKTVKCVVGSDADCQRAYVCTNKYIGECKANVEYNKCEKEK